jgi:hypothetical protein
LRVAMLIDGARKRLWDISLNITQWGWYMLI